MRHPCRSRAALGVVVLAVHGLVIAALLHATLIRSTQQDAAPITVELIEKPPRELPTPPMPQPKLRTIPAVAIPAPEVLLPAEPTSVAITAAVAQSPPSPPAPASPSAPSAELPTMSEVAYLEQPAPRYPPQSRRAREEGLVLLRVLIDESGHAQDIQIVRSSGHPRLDEAARTAVEHALFKPYMQGNRARPAIAMVPVEFSLKHAS